MPRRRFAGAPDPGAQGRKALQLCRQVAEALHWIFGSECGDEVLQGLRVVAVEPAPGTARLLVSVAADAEPAVAAEHLRRAAGLLRSGVAASIHRRKAPELAFRVVPATG